MEVIKRIELLFKPYESFVLPLNYITILILGDSDGDWTRIFLIDSEVHYQFATEPIKFFGDLDGNRTRIILIDSEMHYQSATKPLIDGKISILYLVEPFGIEPNPHALQAHARTIYAKVPLFLGGERVESNPIASASVLQTPDRPSSHSLTILIYIFTSGDSDGNQTRINFIDSEAHYQSATEP